MFCSSKSLNPLKKIDEFCKFTPISFEKPVFFLFFSASYAIFLKRVSSYF